MIKDLDERLVLINGENYDQQWNWKDYEEMEKDIIDYFGLDIDDEAELNMFFKKVEFDEAGDYVFSGMGECFYTLKDALDNEFNGCGLYNIEHYSKQEQEEILDYVYNTDEELTKEKYLKIVEELDPDYCNGMSCETFTQRNVIKVSNQDEWNKNLIGFLREVSDYEEESDEELLERYENNFKGEGLYDFWLGNDMEFNSLYKLEDAIELLKEITLDNLQRR